MSSHNALNVFKTPLALHSKSPVTGFFRDGYCRTGFQDQGSHSVAGVVTEEFLDFTATRGNDLRMAGLKGGCKWCLCSGRWLEAFDAYKDGVISKAAVPKVVLAATEASALKTVDMEQLEEFAVDKPAKQEL